MFNKTIALAVLLTITTFSQTQASDQWSFEITPYLWAVGKDGQTGVKNVAGTSDLVADVDMSFSDIWDRLDRAFLINTNASHGPWTVRVDFVHMKISEDARVERLQAEMEVKETALEGVLAYHPESWQYFDIFAGARYIDAETEITVTTTGEEAISATTTIGDSWLDPIVGLKFTYPVNERWTLSLRGDIGGFGVNSDFTWQGLALIRYKASELISINLAYRYLDAEYEKDNYLYDLSTQGPLLGITFAF